MQRRRVPANARFSPLVMAALLLAFLFVAGAPLAQPAAAQIPHVPLIGYGQTIPGEVTTSFGTEHSFTGCVGETFGFSVTADDFSPRVELYGADDDEPIASAVAPSNADTVIIDGQIIAESGPYIIVVKGRNRSDRGGYSLTLQGTSSDPGNPMPDDSGLRLKLAYGDEVDGSIDANTIEQWNFRGCEGDEILAEVAADGFVPEILLFYPFAESPIATSESADADNGESVLLRRTLPANGAYNMIVAGVTEEDAGDYSLALTLEGRSVVAGDTPQPQATPTATPVATQTGGPRPRRGVPTPKSDTTPTPSATPSPAATRPAATPTATPTPEYIMPGVGESAFRVLDVSSEGGPVNHVAYSPDGSLIATAGEDGEVRVWDAFSGELLQTLSGHESRANYVAFSPDDELVAGASDDGTVRLWDQVGRQTGVLEMPVAGVSGVNSVEFGPDSASLVATTDADEVFVWNVAQESVRFTLEGHAGPVYHAVYSADGAMIATGDSLGVVRLWDAESGELIDALPVNAGPGSGDPVLSVAFSSDGSAIVVGGVIGINDAGVQVWDIASGDAIGELKGHQEWGSTAAISPDDAYIFSAGRAEPGHDGPVNATARIWNTETGALAVALVGYESSVITAVFRPDGSELLTSDGQYVYIWPEPMLATLGAAFGDPIGVQIPRPTDVATPTAGATTTATPRATATATPTRTPNATPAVTRTVTPTVAPTVTPTATPEDTSPPLTLSIFCTVITDRLNLRPGPGTNFNPPIDLLETGDLLVVIGRNADSTWLQVALLDVNLDVEAVGWVSAEFVFCVGEVADAPVVEVE